MPVPDHSVFTGQMTVLPPNQERQSTEGTLLAETKRKWISESLAFKLQSIRAYVVNWTVCLQLVMNVLWWLVLYILS